MKILIAAFLAFFIPFLVTVASVWAFEPRNQRTYPFPEWKSYVVEAIQKNKEATYRAVDQYGYHGWQQLVRDSLDSNSSYQFSLGRILTAAVPGFRIREATASETPSMQHFAVSASVQQTYCDDPNGWSTACVFLLNPLPAPAYYKSSAMLTYIRTGQIAVIEHEAFHAVGRACDQYRGGCPLASTGQWESVVQCTYNPDTLMDCGCNTAGCSARYAQPFEVQTFLLATGFNQTPTQTPTPVPTATQTPVPCGFVGNVVDWGNGVTAQFNTCDNKWHGSNDYDFEVTTRDWWVKDKREWGTCYDWGGRWNYLVVIDGIQGTALSPGSGVYHRNGNYWSIMPTC